MNNKEKYLLKEIRLAEIICKKAFFQGNFTLSSGVNSEYYLDLRNITLNPEGISLITDIIYNKIPKNIDLIGGPELSAVPIISTLIKKCYEKKRNMFGFIFRDRPKPYGMMKMIEGIIPYRPNVMIVDDITTSGNSILKTIEYIEQIGCKVELVMVVVDRGGKKKIKDKGYEFKSVFYYETLLNDYRDIYND